MSIDTYPKAITLKMTEAMFKALTRIAKLRKMKRTDIIRPMLEAGIKKESKK